MNRQDVCNELADVLHSIQQAFYDNAEELLELIGPVYAMGHMINVAYRHTQTGLMIDVQLSVLLRMGDFTYSWDYDPDTNYEGDRDTAIHTLNDFIRSGKGVR